MVGLHEVIIESPKHLTSVTQLDDAQFAEVLGVYRERLEMLRREGEFRNIALFKNSGLLGGATLSHLHSQLIATNSPAGMLTNRAVQLSRLCTSKTDGVLLAKWSAKKVDMADCW